MSYDRRFLLRNISSLAACTTVLPSFAVSQAAVPRHPRPETLEAGDLLWSADPGARIMLSDDAVASKSDDDGWEAGKARLIARLRQNQSNEAVAAVRTIERMGREDFLDQYLQGLEPGASIPLSGASIAFGHVAIVDKAANGDLSVIEADPRVTPWWRVAMTTHREGVRTQSYSQWIDFHDRSFVWHGRVRDLRQGRDITIAQGREIAAAARKFLGRDYDIFNLDMGDHSGFYCSKLVWVAIWTGIGVAIDGVPRLTRSFWLSPKRLQSLPAIRKLHEPAVYGQP